MAGYFFSRVIKATEAPHLWGEKHGRAEQTLPSIEENDQFAQLAKEAGFSLHAGVAAQEAREHNKLERLCCHISRHAVPEKRISLISAGNIRYKPKTNYSHCSTHVVAPVHPALAALARISPRNDGFSLVL